MRFSIAAVTAALAGLAVAAPSAEAHQLTKRADIDSTILNYALTLEHLEAFFYAQGLQNYTQAAFVAAGFADPFYANLKAIAADEAEHVKFLTGALQAGGYPATAACTYSFPSTDPKTFVALASVLEGVGVSAYLGAAALISSAAYLTAAGSILVVESRHSAYLRSEDGEVPFPQPFETPLDFDEVYSLASAFITSCPSTNPTLPVKAFPSLGVSGSQAGGSTVTFTTTGYKLVLPAGYTQMYAAFLTINGPMYVPATATATGYSAQVPVSFLIQGQIYAVLTVCNETVSDETIAAGPAILDVPYNAAVAQALQS